MELAASSPLQAASPSLRRATDARDRRLHRRVPWVTRVRGLTSCGEEFEATSVDMCAGGLRINLAKPLSLNESLVLYLDDIGRVEGRVSRILPDFGYAVSFTAPPRKRDKIVDQLTWLLNRDRLQLEEERTAERRTSAGQVIATFGAGVAVACSVLDMSIFGVALKTAGPRPMLGERVRIGGRSGTCVRYIDGGFAIDFRTADATAPD